MSVTHGVVLEIIFIVIFCSFSYSKGENTHSGGDALGLFYNTVTEFCKRRVPIERHPKRVTNGAKVDERQQMYNFSNRVKKIPWVGWQPLLDLCSPNQELHSLAPSSHRTLNLTTLTLASTQKCNETNKVKCAASYNLIYTSLLKVLF